MATPTPAEIRDALDTAIHNWAGQPVQLTAHDGRLVTYRSLKSLIDARKYYAGLVVHQTTGKPFRTIKLKTGDAR